MTHHKTDDYYQQLNLTELKTMAQGWVNRFPVIKQVTLYRADRDGKYVLDVRIDDSDKNEYGYFEEYWIDRACYLDRLRDAYITPNTDYCGDWLFLLLEVGGKPLLKDDQVLTDSRLVLFSKVQVLAGCIEADHPELQKHDNLFYFCGNNWYVKYNGKSDTIKDSKGMRYIAFLLDSPGKFSSLDLERLAYGNQSEYNKDYSEMSPKQLEKEGLSQDELYFGGMTQEDKEKLKDTAWELWERAKSKNQKDVEAWEDCKNHLDREYGCIPCEKNNELKFIFKKRFKTEANKVRLRVSKNIETAIEKIKVSNFELAEHLSNKAHLHTGNVLWYKRDSDIDWFIQK